MEHLNLPQSKNEKLTPYPFKPIWFLTHFFTHIRTKVQTIFSNPTEIHIWFKPKRFKPLKKNLLPSKATKLIGVFIPSILTCVLFSFIIFLKRTFIIFLITVKSLIKKGLKNICCFLEIKWMSGFDNPFLINNRIFFK